MTCPTQIFIIGGSHAGLGIAKAIFKAIPKAKVTVVSTSADYYFNLATPRLLARPGQIPIEEILIPIEKLFQKHPSSQFEFVHATVTELDTKNKLIRTDDGALRGFDYLVIASGSHTPAVIQEPCIPVKQTITDDLKERISLAQQAIAKAPRIVIGGGGPVGIELAGEIAGAYPRKCVTMVFASFRLLENLKGAASLEAGRRLNKLGIVVKSGNKVRSVSFNEKSNDWTVVLTDSSEVTADLYISAIGVLPNNNFIPTFLLSQDGWLKCDENLAVKSVSSVYAIGDIVDGQSKMATYIKSHIACVVHNLVADISGVGERKPLKLPYLEGSKYIISKIVALASEFGGSFVPLANLLQSAGANRKWWDRTDRELRTVELDGWLSQRGLFNFKE